MSDVNSPIEDTDLLGGVVLGETYGEGIRLVDIKLAKNFRFSGKRVNVGVDVYNVFNSDAAIRYCDTYPGCAATGTQPAREGYSDASACLTFP